MSSQEKFEYVIHTNELEGHQFTDEEKEIIRKVAFGEISSRQALEYLDKNWYNIPNNDRTDLTDRKRQGLPHSLVFFISDSSI